MASHLRHVRTAVKLSNITHCSDVCSSVRWAHTGYIRAPATHLNIRSAPTLQRGILRACVSGVHPSWHRSQALCALIPLRSNSTSTTTADNTESQASGSLDIQALPDGYIPEPPPIPVPEVPDITLNALGEQSLQSLGLCHNTPSGYFQWALENLHCTLDIPWWGCIVAATVTIRLLIFPLVIVSQRNVAQMNNHMPTVQRLQERFSRARMSSNPMEAAQAGHELMDYMKRNKVSPFKNMLVPMAQLPIFLSVFVGLRQMANLPVDSMMTGGMLWFTDLTVPDPYYALPLITMATLFATIELGVDTVRASNMTHTMKWVMRLMPCFVLPFIINFPMAMLCYWLTSNVFSLCQVMFLKLPGVRPFFNIPEMVKHEDSNIAAPKKKFIEGFKDTWSNSKMLASIEDRARVDAVKFKEAGMQPVQKTFPFNPTKVKPKDTTR